MNLFRTLVFAAIFSIAAQAEAQWTISDFRVSCTSMQFTFWRLSDDPTVANFVLPAGQTRELDLSNLRQLCPQYVNNDFSFYVNVAFPFTKRPDADAWRLGRISWEIIDVTTGQTLADAAIAAGGCAVDGTNSAHFKLGSLQGVLRPIKIRFKNNGRKDQAFDVNGGYNGYVHNFQCVYSTR